MSFISPAEKARFCGSSLIVEFDVANVEARERYPLTAPISIHRRSRDQSELQILRAGSVTSAVCHLHAVFDSGSLVMSETDQNDSRVSRWFVKIDATFFRWETQRTVAPSGKGQNGPVTEK